MKKPLNIFYLEETLMLMFSSVSASIPMASASFLTAFASILTASASFLPSSTYFLSASTSFPSASTSFPSASATFLSSFTSLFFHQCQYLFRQHLLIFGGHLLPFLQHSAMAAQTTAERDREKEIEHVLKISLYFHANKYPGVYNDASSCIFFNFSNSFFSFLTFQKTGSGPTDGHTLL